MGDATGTTSTSALNIGDNIDGQSGTDTLNLLLAGAAAGALPAGVVVSGVEKINLIHTDDRAGPRNLDREISASLA